jgi:hypothetical protein
MPGGYGKPARSGAAKRDISEASFRPTEADHKTVDSNTGLWLTKAAERTVDTQRGSS